MYWDKALGLSVTSLLSTLDPGASEFAAATAQLFDEWVPLDAQQLQLRNEYRSFVEESGAASARREGGPQHLTASAFVFNDDLTHVLLCFHRKGQFWVQVGGHTEPGDADLAGSALREAQEESGMDALELMSQFPSDLNRHDLASAFGACKTHWDVGFIFRAPKDAQIVVSSESEDVQWWPTDGLPAATPPDFPSRVAFAVTAARRAASHG